VRVFVTGASGFIGTAVVPELLDHGHDVIGLARSDAAADRVAALGAEVHRGSLDDLASLRSGAAASDGVIHLAFIHDFSNFAHSIEADQRAIDALGNELEGSDRPLLNASGVLGLAKNGRTAIERDEYGPEFPRATAANTTIAFAARGVRSSVVRLAPTVHGEGDHGFVATLVETARKHGVSGYIGDGAARWPAVHRFDAARLYRVALEQASAGSVLHAVADEGIPVRNIADVIGAHLDLPVVSIAPEDAAEHFDWLAPLLALDSPASSAATRELLGWEPVHPGLIEDLDAGHYFDGPAA